MNLRKIISTVFSTCSIYNKVKKRKKRTEQNRTKTEKKTERCM